MVELDDMNCALNLAANRRLSHLMGAIKKGDTNKESVSTVGYGRGNMVGVNNHCDKWDYKAYLMLVDFENVFPMVRWETTRKIKNISIFVLEQKQEHGSRQTSCIWTVTRITM